jgi:hypothetical protein
MVSPLIGESSAHGILTQTCRMVAFGLAAEGDESANVCCIRDLATVNPSKFEVAVID